VDLGHFLKSNIGKRRVLKTTLLLQKRKLYLTYGMALCLVTLTGASKRVGRVCQHQLNFLYSIF